jgi:hypothetical protein
VLSRGDSTLAAVLAEMERDSLPGWYQAVEEKQIDADFFAHRLWAPDSQLPWSIIQYYPAVPKDS